MCRQLSPGESNNRQRHMTMMMMSVNEGGDSVGIDGLYVDLSPGEDDDGAPRHSSHFAVASRSLSRSASM